MFEKGSVAITKSCILINEDPSEQAVFVKALRDISPRMLCFTAVDGVDGLYMMLEEGIVPDYIFAEMVMPRMDAIGFLKQIKKIELLKDIPVIVHTISPMPHQVIELKEAGAAALYLREYEYDGICNMLSLYVLDTIPAIFPN